MKGESMLTGLLRAVCLIAALFLANMAYNAGGSRGMEICDTLAILALLLVFSVGIFISILSLFRANKALPTWRRAFLYMGMEWFTIGLALANLANVVWVVLVMVLGIIVMWAVLFVTVEYTNIDAVSEDQKEVAT